MKLQKLNFIILLISTTFFFSCTGSGEKEIKIIKTDGADAVYNMSKSNIQFGSVSLGDKISGISVEDGDLLYVLPGESAPEVMIRYSSFLGNELSFRCDSLEPFILKLNNQIFALQLYDSISWNWVKNATSDVLKGIHSVSLSLPVEKDQFEILSSLISVSQLSGAMINAESGLHHLDKILFMCQLEWLYISTDTTLLFSDIARHNLNKIELLYLNEATDSVDNINHLQKLNHLQQLIISSGSCKYKTMNLSEYHNLKSLSIIESQIMSTGEIQLPDKLKSLYFLSCDSLFDVQNLSKYNKLRILGFTQCRRLQDISSIHGMKNLIWLSCPPGMNQIQFDTLIPSLQSLHVLELINCDSLKSIEAIKELKSIKSLTLACKNINSSSANDMKNLELLILQPDTGKAGELKIMQLRNRLPNTLVVPGKGFCLGSGWILILLPLTGLILFLFRRLNF